MQRAHEQLRDDALRIWHAGVDAVRSERLVGESFRVEGPDLIVGDERLRLDAVRHIVVVGAGKAGAGMAAAVEEVLGPRLCEEKELRGWVNVPENCVRPLSCIHLHGARPPGVNEPTPAGAAGSAEILRLVESLTQSDLCLCLISGGGSALMPAPVEAISLDDKLAVTRHLSAAGANIEELNMVRKQLSRIKGGGLMRACRAGRLVSLVISDVLGDPLDVIASGPTVEDSSTPEAALEVLGRFDARSAGISEAVFEYLRQKRAAKAPEPTCRVTNRIIGNNATAVDAAGREAERLGYSPAEKGDRSNLCDDQRCASVPAFGPFRQIGPVPFFTSEGPAEEIGRSLAEMAVKMRDEPGPDCLVSGGEPVVKLAPAKERGLGGRSQQLVLAALQRLTADGASGIALLSGGTDGEDGPTDAAGAILDASILSAAQARGLDPADFLARNDAYHFFEPLGGLIKTGPTHTNVCDLRVVVVNRVC